MLIGAIVLWLGREPILEALDLEVVDEDEASKTPTQVGNADAVPANDGAEIPEALDEHASPGDQNEQ